MTLRTRPGENPPDNAARKLESRALETNLPAALPGPRLMPLHTESPPLAELHAEIDARVAAIRSSHTDWPCAKGCDACCRHLAALPQLTAVEWELLRPTIAALPAARLEQVAARIAALAAVTRGPLTCPLLDEMSGACPVYAQRPVACRSYGYYAQRDGGLYCGQIAARVDDGSLAEVVWGNHDAVDRQLARLGETRAISNWFGEWFAAYHVPAATS